MRIVDYSFGCAANDWYYGAMRPHRSNPGELAFVLAATVISFSFFSSLQHTSNSALVASVADSTSSVEGTEESTVQHNSKMQETATAHDTSVPVEDTGSAGDDVIAYEAIIFELPAAPPTVPSGTITELTDEEHTNTEDASSRSSDYLRIDFDTDPPVSPEETTPTSARDASVGPVAVEIVSGRVVAIRLSVSEPAVARLFYRAPTEATQRERGSVRGERHTFILDDLTPNSEYTYAISLTFDDGSERWVSSGARFRTPAGSSVSSEPARVDPSTPVRTEQATGAPERSTPPTSGGNVPSEAPSNTQPQTTSIDRSLETLRTVYEYAPREERAQRLLTTERARPQALLDSDGDGIVDFDEVVLFGTDPLNARTAGAEGTDGELVLAGRDPQEPSRMIVPEDPRTSNAPVLALLELESLSVVSVNEAREQVRLSGRALPSAMVTLYIFSAPIVVRVRADESGFWEYTLEDELPDGTHTAFVAVVDRTGAIQAQSAPAPFVKEAQAVEFVATAASDAELARSHGLFASTFPTIIALMTLAAFLLALVLLGSHKRPEEDVSPPTHA